MDSEQKFWLSVWTLVLIGVCCLILSVTGGIMHSKYQIAKAIERGANPIEAKFAFRADSAGDNVIVLGEIMGKKLQKPKFATP